MRNFEISTDSTSDIYAEEREKLGVYLSPLMFTIEEKGELNEHLDAFKSQDEYVEFYNKLRKGAVAKTAILNLQAHIDLFEEMAKAGVKNAIHITQSYGLSPTLDNANRAIEIVKEQYPDINYLAMESSTTTVGEGNLVRIAVEMRDKGLELEDAFKQLQEIKGKIQHFIAVEDLMYLKRGGRVSGVSAAIGTVLKIRPILQITRGGKLEITAKEMGKKKAFRRIIEDIKKFTPHKEYFRGTVVHTDNLEEAKELQQEIKNTFGWESDIRIMGPIIGAHVGPNAVAFTFISNEKRPVE